jgi:hypothetical protein
MVPVAEYHLAKKLYFNPWFLIVYVPYCFQLVFITKNVFIFIQILYAYW